MKPSIFLSYSRREVGFVDQLTDQLQKAGFRVWLDYRSLIPGSPWKKQVEKGLDESEVILLVVSKESMASRYVELEWRRVIKENKRIILAIFEAVDLPVELEQFEWVDFRGSFKKGVQELCAQLEQPVEEEHPVPETGFKIPSIVWLAFALSLAVMGYAVAGFWALFVPWFLIPLPYRILKRNFNFTEVQTSLLILPVVLYLSADAAYTQEKFDFMNYAMFSSLAFVIPLLFVLRSAGMQRWGKPEATLPRFASPYKSEDINPRPVSFFIDHALQDRLIAEKMAQAFAEYGHISAVDIMSAEVVFVLMSTFQLDTDADPEKQVVYPILVQAVLPVEKLSRIQWIDFRGGVRNLDAIAQLMAEPSKLLAALGIRPLGNQLVLPPIIMAMRYFVILISIFSAGAILNYILDFYEIGFETALTGDIWVGFVLTFVAIGVCAFFMLRHLTARRGWFASFSTFTFGLVALGGLIFSQDILEGLIYDSLTAAEQAHGISPAILYPRYVYVIGMVVMTAFFIFRNKDVRRWFPARVKRD